MSVRSTNGGNDLLGQEIPVKFMVQSSKSMVQSSWIVRKTN